MKLVIFICLVGLTCIAIATCGILIYAACALRSDEANKVVGSPLQHQDHRWIK